MAVETKLTRTLLLTIAVPDVWAEDLTMEQAQEFYGGDFNEMAYNELALISSTVKLFIATGDKGGNDVHDLRGVIVGFEVDGRDPKYDEPEDERLTAGIDEWAEWRTGKTDSTNGGK